MGRFGVGGFGGGGAALSILGMTQWIFLAILGNKKVIVSNVIFLYGALAVPKASEIFGHKPLFGSIFTHMNHTESPGPTAESLI